MRYKYTYYPDPVWSDHTETVFFNTVWSHDTYQLQVRDGRTYHVAIIQSGIQHLVYVNKRLTCVFSFTAEFFTRATGFIFDEINCQLASRGKLKAYPGNWGMFSAELI